jgi:hypothetical protein
VIAVEFAYHDVEGEVWYLRADGEMTLGTLPPPGGRSMQELHPEQPRLPCRLKH